MEQTTGLRIAARVHARAVGDARRVATQLPAAAGRAGGPVAAAATMCGRQAVQRCSLDCRTPDPDEEQANERASSRRIVVRPDLAYGSLPGESLDLCPPATPGLRPGVFADPQWRLGMGRPAGVRQPLPHRCSASPQAAHRC